MLPDEVAAFRARYREQHVGAGYRGWLHVAVTSLGSLAAIAFAISRVRAPTLGQLAALPVFFLIANLGEYFGHRGPMHHRKRGLGLVFERHALQHHRFYTHDAMAADSPRDFKMVLFPPVMLVFFLGGMAAPIGLVVGLALGANLGWLFAATAVGYFLTYEWLHFAYHQPETHLDRPQPDRRAAAPAPRRAPRSAPHDARELQHHVPDRRPAVRDVRARLTLRREDRGALRADGHRDRAAGHGHVGAAERVVQHGAVREPERWGSGAVDGRARRQLRDRDERDVADRVLPREDERVLVGVVDRHVGAAAQRGQLLARRAELARERERRLLVGRQRARRRATSRGCSDRRRRTRRTRRRSRSSARPAASAATPARAAARAYGSASGGARRDVRPLVVGDARIVRRVLPAVGRERDEARRVLAADVRRHDRARRVLAAALCCAQ